MGTASAKAIFDADDSRMDAVMTRMDKKLQRLESTFHKFGNVAEKALAMAGATWVAAKGWEAFNEVLEKGHHLENLSAMTGAAVGDLYVLEKMFKKAGGSAEDAGDLIGHMQKTLAAGSAGNILEQMGLDPEHLRHAAAPEAFLEIGEAIRKIPNAADRAAVSMEVFGKKGRETLAIFADGHAVEMFENSRQSADIYERSAGVFSEIHERMAAVAGRLDTSWLILADRLSAVVLPLLDKVTNALAKWNQNGFVAAAGDTAAVYGEAALQGRLGELAGASLDKQATDILPNWINKIFDHVPFMDTQAEKTAKFDKIFDSLYGDLKERDAKQREQFKGGTDDGSLFDFSGAANAGITTLGRIGGNWGGGGGGDPLIDEARAHTRILQTISDKLPDAKGGGNYSSAASGGGTWED